MPVTTWDGEPDQPRSTADEISELVASYRAAFQHFDAAAIAECFRYPVHVTADGPEPTVTSAPDLEAWTRQVERLLEMYRAIGVRSVECLDLAMMTISPGLHHVLIEWELRDGQGRALYRFDASYTVVRVGDGLRITAIAHNEIPSYRECVERLRAG